MESVLDLYAIKRSAPTRVLPTLQKKKKREVIETPIAILLSEVSDGFDLGYGGEKDEGKG